MELLFFCLFGARVEPKPAPPKTPPKPSKAPDWYWENRWSY